jgi:hypothetical protein
MLVFGLFSLSLSFCVLVDCLVGQSMGMPSSHYPAGTLYRKNNNAQATP